jgi:hypothetical protein
MKSTDDGVLIFAALKFEMLMKQELFFFKFPRVFFLIIIKPETQNLKSQQLNQQVHFNGGNPLTANTLPATCFGPSRAQEQTTKAPRGSSNSSTVS